MIGAQIGARIGARIGIPSSQTTLSVTITDSQDPVPTQTTYTYTTIVTNTGTAVALNVIASVTADGDLDATAAVGDGWSIEQAGQTFTCTRAALPPGAAPAIIMTVKSDGVDEDVVSTADAIADNASLVTASQTTTIFVP